MHNNSTHKHAPIGHTPLREIPELSEAFNIPNLRIKDESTNPNGTWKDRRSAHIIRHLNGRPAPHICLITAGNAAFSIAKLADQTRIRITALVSDQINPEIAEQLEKEGVRVLPVKLDHQIYSEEIERIAKISPTDQPIDVTHSMHSAYTSIINELNPEHPDFIIAPFGTGEGIFGMCMENYRSQLLCPHHAATIIGVKPDEPISYADKLSGNITPYREMLREFQQEGQTTLTVTEQEISDAYAIVSPHLHVEPSSAATFAALSHLSFKPTDRVVVVNSGRGVF